jgi:hypothetical protein
MAKTQALWWERVTSHGTTESNEATVAPSPRSTKSEGNAQQRSVPSEVNRDR